MIIKMKKLTLLCLAELQSSTLEKLAELGAVQVVNDKLKDSGDRQEQALLMADVERIINAISAFEECDKPIKFEGDVYEILNKLEDSLLTYDSAVKERELLQRQMEALKPWGDFSPALIKQLAEQGIKAELCIFNKESFDKFVTPDGVTLSIISQNKTMVYALALYPESVEVTLPMAISLPSEYSYSELSNKVVEQERIIEINSEVLASGLAVMDQLKSLKDSYSSEYEFLAARDGMKEFGEISVLSGYIPVTQTETLLAMAREDGWGIKLDEPTEEELPPVLLDLPKWLEPIRPLLEFLGILPGYREVDVSLSMLIFMTIFVGMIVNDAGYGCIFLVASLAGIFCTRKSPKGRQTFALTTIFSVFTVIWGVLSGCWFGLEWGGISFLTDASKDANTQFICFSLAVIHLTIGHLIQLFKKPKFRNIMAQIGWMMVLAGFYITALKVVAYPGAMPAAVQYLLGGGIVILLVFNLNWKDIGSIFNFPFEVINCFTDTLSYIRLFAVGMAGGYMAVCFNGMAMDIMSAGWWAIPFGVLLILLAHGLNIALGMISVLVHGVRLNTLEFSSHSSITWSGTEFKPLKKNQQSK